MSVGRASWDGLSGRDMSARLWHTIKVRLGTGALDGPPVVGRGESAHEVSVPSNRHQSTHDDPNVFESLPPADQLTSLTLKDILDQSLETNQ